MASCIHLFKQRYVLRRPTLVTRHAAVWQTCIGRAGMPFDVFVYDEHPQNVLSAGWHAACLRLRGEHSASSALRGISDFVTPEKNFRQQQLLF